MMDYIYELDDSFMHSGVKGQQWGRRRYQNSDGSLTPEGRLHYGIGKMRTAAKNYGAQAKYKAKKMGVRAGLAADKYGALAKQRAGEYGAHAKTMAGIAGALAKQRSREYGSHAKTMAGIAGSLAKQRAREYGLHAKTMASIAGRSASSTARNYLNRYRNKPIQSVDDSAPQTKTGRDWISDWASRYTASQFRVREPLTREQESRLRTQWDSVRQIDEQFYRENARQLAEERRKAYEENSRPGYVNTIYGPMSIREARMRDIYG